MEETSVAEQEAKSKSAKDFVARAYQVELLEKAIECNTIVCLKTGAGKTLIAILLIKELQHEILGDYKSGGRRTVFLVPKVPLVHQQSKAIRAHTSLKVGAYYGAMGVDYWNKTQWLKELVNHNVLVMTAQILVNMLQHGYMDLTRINLLIFDECHAATGNSPYVSILDRFKDVGSSSQPRILGLTASIVNGKCKPTQVEKIMRRLEDAMRSRIETASNLAVVHRHATKPREVIVSCTNTITTTLEKELCDMVSAALELMAPHLRNVEKRKSRERGGEPKLGFFDAVRKGGRTNFEDLIKQVHTWSDEDDFQLSDGIDFSGSPSAMLKHLLTVMMSLGLYCAKLILEHFVRDIPRLLEDCRFRFDRDEELLYDIVGNTLGAIQRRLESHFRDTGGEPAAILRHVSPRLARLMELLTDLLDRCDVEPDPRLLVKADDAMEVDGTDNDVQPIVVEAQVGGTGGPALNVFRGIVFVEQRVVAWILSEYLQRARTARGRDFVGLRPCYMVGHGMNVVFLKRSTMSHQKQDESLENFRSGVCNVMVATKVVEEGLDIPKCNLVVRFDQPKDFCSYVQSMGRARAERALYVMLIEQDNLNALTEDVSTYKMIEHLLNLKSHRRELPTDRDAELRLAELHKLPPYYPGSHHGACLDLNTAIALLYWYCNQLPHDTYSLQRPSFKYEENEQKEVRCILRLPVDSMHHQLIEGDLMPDRKLAKKAAAYRACIMLHQHGELNDHLLPSIKYLEKYLVMLGVVPDEDITTTLVISAPGTSKRRRIYTKTVAAELTGNQPLAVSISHLYAITYAGEESGERCCYGMLTSKELPPVPPFVVYEKLRLTVRFRSVGSCTLSTDQLNRLTDFHRTLFADILLLAPDLMSYVSERAFSSHLIVPLKERDFPSNFAGFDWDTVDRFASYKAAGTGKVGNYDDFKTGAVVTTLHRRSVNQNGRFLVLNRCDDMSPLSPFPSNTFPSYADYFRVQYEANVTDLRQPLVHVDYAPNTLNMLFPSLPDPIRKNERRYQHLIPELCAVLPLDVEMYRQAMAVPCSLHRLNGVLNARHLMSAVLTEVQLLHPSRIFPLLEPLPFLESAVAACPVTDDVIYSSGGPTTNTEEAHLAALFFQSLTTKSAANWDDLERLEVIGDSFLKFTTSQHLFNRFSHLNEGALSLLRTGLVKNHNLYHHAGMHGLPHLLNATSFAPRTMWLPPGYVIPEALSSALVTACVPSHLWPHARMEDVTLASNPEALLDTLNHRWAGVDPAYRDNAFAAVPNGTSCLSDDDGGDSDYATSIADVNHFEQHLIGDKTVADSAEALVGAVLVSCGQEATVKFLLWLGLKVGPTEAQENGEPSRWEPPRTALLENTSATAEDLAKLYAPLETLEQSLGYTFREKSFLLQAVIHSSYARHPVTDSYQRLEFLGDAVLDYLVTMHMYKKFPNLSPGDLTDLRSSLVDNSTFAYLSVRAEFHKHLKYCSHQLFSKIDKYLSYQERLTHPKEMLYLVNEDETLNLDDIEVPKALGDLFESIAGAVYLDCGLSLEVVWSVFFPLMADVIELYSKELPINPVRVLIEKYPNTKFSPPVKCEGSFVVKVIVKNKAHTGCGKNRRIARQAAAKAALRSLQIKAVRTLNCN